MDIKSFPNNKDEECGAEDVMRWLHGRTSGVFAAEENCAVTASQEGMAVLVSDGVGWISNREQNGVVWWNNVEKESNQKLSLPIAAAHSTLDRIDRVVVSWETTNYVSYPRIEILQGEFSSSAVAPALTNNNSLRQISLARISVPAGTISLSVANITDERLDTSVCGIVTDAIKIDTSVWNAQLNELIEHLRTAIEQAEFGILPDGAVTNTKIVDGAVTPDKLDRSYFETATPMILTAGVHYGDSLPEVGVEGQLFFKRV